MIDFRESARTYDLTTASGAASALVQTVAPLAAIAIGLWKIEKWEGYAVVLAGIGAIILAMWVGPAWICWARRNVAEVVRLENKARTMTERIRLAEIALEQERARAETLDKLRMLDHDQISLALEMERGELFNIEGNRVTWTVNGVVMPVTFSLDWLEKWEARRAIHPDELPAMRDWDNDAHREQCRTYNAAILAALVKLGYIQQAGSQYPARWLYDDETYRWRGLALIGLDLSLAISRGILEGENDEQHKRPD